MGAISTILYKTYINIMKISDLKLNYIYTIDDNIIYKVIYIEHNSKWAVCIRYSFDENIGETEIIDNDWLDEKDNMSFHIVSDVYYYNMSLVTKKKCFGNILIQMEN